MVNGSAARSLPALELPSTPTTVSAEPPAAGLESAIGVAVADAVLALYRAMWDFQQGDVLSPTTREAGGSRMARVATLMLDHGPGDRDFIALAHRAGRCELRRHLAHLDAELFRRHESVEVDKVLDRDIDSVFEIVRLAVRDERSFRAALAN